MSRAVFVCTLLSLVPLSAQEESPLVDLSGGLRIECAGPELIRRLLLPTDLGAMVEGHELQRAVLFQGREESRWTLRLLW